MDEAAQGLLRERFLLAKSNGCFNHRLDVHAGILFSATAFAFSVRTAERRIWAATGPLGANARREWRRGNFRRRAAKRRKHCGVWIAIGTGRPAEKFFRVRRVTRVSSAGQAVLANRGQIGRTKVDGHFDTDGNGYLNPLSASWHCRQWMRAVVDGHRGTDRAAVMVPGSPGPRWRLRIKSFPRCGAGRLGGVTDFVHQLTPMNGKPR